MLFATLFWLATLGVLYTYIGYPMLIQLRSIQRPKEAPFDQRAKPEEWPTIAFIVPVYNEASNIAKKITNLKAIDYPTDRVNICFVSDGSDDETETLFSDYPDVQFISYESRAGKPTALNRGVEQQSADIIVFTDARQEIEPSAIKRLVSRLEDETIGAVSGELEFITPQTHTGSHVSLYWNYEKWIREAESQYDSVAGVTGALYAIRREDYSPLYPEAILDDFEVPMAILRKGKRVVLEVGAKVFDTPQERSDLEKVRKIRTLTGNFQSIDRNRWLLSPSENPIFWQFISHKVCRLVVPYMLMIIFISSLFASGAIYKLALLAQLLFYGVGLCGYLLPPAYATPIQESKIGNFVKMFIELNWTPVIALKNYLTTHVDSKWQKT